MNDKKDIGKLGEELACEYLLSKGYEIIERNWRYGSKEIDIIAKENSTTIFVEVKTRNSTYFGLPEEGLSKKQLKSIMQAAEMYLLKNPNWDIRFDCIAILLEKNEVKDLLHIRDVYV